MRNSQEIVASFNEIADEEYNVRSQKDGRKIVNRLIIGYKATNGDEYRKRFEFDKKASYQDMISQIPQQITVKA